MEEKTERKQISISKNVEPRSQNPMERVALNRETISRIDGWISQMETKVKAIRISRADIANFLLLAIPVELTEEHVEALKNLHFDEVKFSFWLARTLKQAKSNGEKVTLNDLYKRYGRSQNEVPQDE